MVPGSNKRLLLLFHMYMCTPKHNFLLCDTEADIHVLSPPMLGGLYVDFEKWFLK